MLGHPTVTQRAMVGAIRRTSTSCRAGHCRHGPTEGPDLPVSGWVMYFSSFAGPGRVFLTGLERNTDRWTAGTTRPLDGSMAAPMQVMMRMLVTT